MTEKFIYGNEDERIYDRAFRSALFCTPNYVEILCIDAFSCFACQALKSPTPFFLILDSVGGSLTLSYPIP